MQRSLRFPLLEGNVSLVVVPVISVFLSSLGFALSVWADQVVGNGSLAGALLASLLLPAALLAVHSIRSVVSVLHLSLLLVFWAFVLIFVLSSGDSTGDWREKSRREFYRSLESSPDRE